MGHPLRSITLRQFELLLERYAPNGARKLVAVHLHHTWRPAHAGWRGQRTLDAMRDFHVQSGLRDLAQHLTIDPAGGLWTGRDWSWPPASARGANGDTIRGPFMIEMVGNFDRGHDLLDGAQLATVKAACELLLAHISPQVAGARSKRVFFAHRNFTDQKSCCGLELVEQLGRKSERRFMGALAFLNAMQAPARKKAATGRRKPRANFSAGNDTLPPTLLEYPAAKSSISARGFDGYDWNEFEVPERERDDEVPDGTAARSRSRAPNPFAALAPYVINCEHGQLSEDGDYVQTPQAFERIFSELLPAYVRTSSGRPRLMIHAHGGLVSERVALDYTAAHWKWWKQGLGVYPLYFIWESGLWETLLDRLGLDRSRDARGVWSGIRDKTLEALARGPLRWIWNVMKTNAMLASSPSLPEGGIGVARLAAQRLVTLKLAHPELEIHLVGHSAGAIFHAHFIDAIAAANDAMGSRRIRTPLVTSLALLAPAIRIDLFDRLLAPRIGAGKTVGSFELYTMDRDRERNDCCSLGSLEAYSDSLLYWVSRGFDADESAPAALLGLQESLRNAGRIHATDPLPLTFLESAEWKIWWSSARNGAARRSESESHGGFDNDPRTLNSVALRVLGAPFQPGLATPYPNAPDPSPCGRPRSLAEAARTARAAGSAVAANESGPGDASEKTTTAPQPKAIIKRARTGRRLALCVGIDAYIGAELAGCVNDARGWSDALVSLDFKVTQLLDRGAGRARLLNALRTLVASARAGDVLVFQFSGHGTWLADRDGDESDGRDEALVPFDFDTQPALLDDELRVIYRKLPANARLYLFMDCCHSGSNSRMRMAPAESSSGRVRFLAPTPRMQALAAAVRKKTPVKAPAQQPRDRWVHFAACQDDEFAWEHDGSGDFTRAALPNLVAAVHAGHAPSRYLSAIKAKFGPRAKQHPSLLATDADYAAAPLFEAASLTLRARRTKA